MKVDGISKYIDDHAFTFDNTFGETEVNMFLLRETKIFTK